MTHALKERIANAAGSALESVQKHGGTAINAIQEHGGELAESAWKGTKSAAKQVGSAVSGLAGQVREGAEGVRTSYVKSREEAKTAQSAFASLAPVIDLILPSEGSMCTVDVQFEIPVGKGVGFVGMHVTGTIARGTYVAGTGSALSGSAVQLGLYVAITGGAELHLGSARIEAGAYIGTQGPTATGALDIGSWTLYRNLLAESNLIPRELVDAMYGKGDLSAADWDEETRERYFKPGGSGYDPTNSGTVGLSVGASGDIGTGPVTGSVGAKIKAGRVYDAKSIERREGAKSTTQKLMGKAADSGVRGISDLGEALADSDRGAQASLGDRALTFVGSAAVDAKGIGSTSVTVTAVLRQSKDKRAQQQSSEWALVSLMVDATAKSPALDVLASVTSGAASIVPIVQALVKASKKATDNVKNTVAKDKGTNAGKALESITDFSEGLGTALSTVSGMPIPATLPGIISTGAIHLAGGMQAKKMNLYIGFEKVTSLGFDVNVFTASFEKIERIGSIEYDGEAWVVHFGELEKEVARSKNGNPHAAPHGQAQPHGPAQPQGQAHHPAPVGGLAQPGALLAASQHRGKPLPPVPVRGGNPANTVGGHQ